jgi:CRISPR/Cas system-associated protein Csm6
MTEEGQIGEYLICYHENDGDCDYFYTELVKTYDEAIAFMANEIAVGNNIYYFYVAKDDVIICRPVPEIPEELIEERREFHRRRREIEREQKLKQFEEYKTENEKKEYQRLKEKYG